jgi:hypothetical protein
MPDADAAISSTASASGIARGYCIALWRSSEHPGQSEWRRQVGDRKQMTSVLITDLVISIRMLVLVQPEPVRERNATKRLTLQHV